MSGEQVSVVQTAVYSLLVSDTAIASWVEDRVYPLVIPQETYDRTSRKPCLVYAVLSDSRQRLFCGTDDLVEILLSVDACALVYRDAAMLGELVREHLIDYQGAVAGFWFDRVLWGSGAEIYRPEPGLYSQAMTFVAYCRRMAP